MSVTLVGALIIPVALCAWVLAPHWLYALAIFSVPFSATALINIAPDSIGFGVQAYILLGGLWMLRMLVDTMLRGSEKISREVQLPLTLLVGFGLVVVASLAMPWWIDGRIDIIRPDRTEAYWLGSSYPLYFSAQHLTQTVYVLFGIALTVALVFANQTLASWWRTLRIYVTSLLFVSAWGWFQWFCYRFGVEYPTLFNNSVSRSALGFDTEIEGLQRVSSVAVEPSIMAQTLLIAIPFLLFAILFRTPLLGRWRDRIALGLIVSALLISTALSGYIGLGLISVVALVVLVTVGRLPLGYVALALLAPIGLVVSYAVSPTVQDLVERLALNKLGSLSGSERLTSIRLAWDYFVRYPFLGVGWGSVTSHDLLARLLANSGMTGLLLFVGTVIAALSHLGRRLQTGFVTSTSGIALTVGLGTLVSALAFFGVCILTSFPYVFGHFWLLLALLIASPAALTSARAHPSRTTRPVPAGPQLQRSRG